MDDSKKITVTIKENGVYRDILLDPWMIEYIKPSLAACEIYFVDNQPSLYIYQDEKELTRRIQQSKRLSNY